MATELHVPTGLIWATRGYSWGFRFLLDGGFEDPLPEYERVFAGVARDATVWHRHVSPGALRFPDPEERRDRSGRPIPHEFVVPVEFARDIRSVQAGIDVVWSFVADTYARCWDSDSAPSRETLGF